MNEPAQRSTILVADQELGMRDLFCYCFDAARYEVETAASAVEAVEAVKRRAFDLVVLDIHMPPTTGSEPVDEIRRLRPDQKLLLLSSGAELTGQPEGLGDRGVPCLFKPVSLDELTCAVDTLLASPSPPEGELRE